MKIWLLRASEASPFLLEEAANRPGRGCQVAQSLSESKHTVTWFNSQFSHVRKRMRDVPANRVVSLPGSAMDFVFLKSRGYQKNIGLKRFIDHYELGRNFERMARTMEHPDIILAHYPSIDLAWRAIRFGQRNNVPVVVDVRDMWPDVIYERLNEKVAHLGVTTDGLLLPYEHMGQFIFQNAKAVTAVSSGMLNWAQHRFGRPKRLRAFDRPFFQMQPSLLPVPPDSQKARTFQESWLARGIDLRQDKLRFVWSGSIVRNTDGKTLLAALGRLPSLLQSQIEVIICGLGDFEEDCIQAAARIPCLKVVGWINYDELSYLMEAAHIGLMCYLDRDDFQRSVPNKVVDYTRAGMRILTNITGDLARLADGTDILVGYKAGDPENLVAVFERLVADKHRLLQKIPDGRAFFEQHFCADRVLSDIEVFLEQVLEHHCTALSSKEHQP